LGRRLRRVARGHRARAVHHRLMRVLVDAHALLWWLAGDRRLSAGARGVIEGAEQSLIGAGTLAEIAIKRSLGKLEIDENWPEQVQADGFVLLPIGWAHA